MERHFLQDQYLIKGCQMAGELIAHSAGCRGSMRCGISSTEAMGKGTVLCDHEEYSKVLSHHLQLLQGVQLLLRVS